MTIQPIVNNDYDAALRRRLSLIGSMGDQQNAYVANQAAQKQQADYQAAMAQPAGQQTTAGSDYSNTNQAANPNPRSVQQALDFAKQAVASGDSSWYRRCLAFVAQAYGIASGSPTAISAWQRLNNTGMQHTDSNPNVGSAVYWDTGQGRAGHVALYAGNGQVYSNDIGGAGKISLVPLSDISKKWGSTYLGWSDPYFANSPKQKR